MRINVIKLALAEAREICRNHKTCYRCPFNNGKVCVISSPKVSDDDFMPMDWDLDSLKEGARDEK